MAVDDKIDLFKLHKDEYAAPKKPTIVRTKKTRYLAVEGRGGPGSDAFQAKIGALYGMAYTIKMTRKFAGEQDYTICKLEGIYWADGDADVAELPKDEWCWQLMIRTPDFVKQKELDRAAATLEEKGKGEGARDVRLESLSEGKCVQMLHVGPYESEPETIARMQEFMAEEGLTPAGRHHEIYVSDPRRVPQERLKTILRQPVRNA